MFENSKRSIKISLPKREKEFKEFQIFKNRAIDHEQGSDFHKNISEKGTQFFFCKYSFIIFKIMRIEDVNTCYIYYMFADNPETFRSAYYSMINYCIGSNVKFIYYSEKSKSNFYTDFLLEEGYKIEEEGPKEYASDFLCSKCSGTKDTCTCSTLNCYI